MNIKKTLFASIMVLSLSPPSFADNSDTQAASPQPNPEMNMPGQHMMGGHQGGMPMMGGPQGRGMPMMNMMQQKQAHMQRMETHLGNIEALLRELVALQKK